LAFCRDNIILNDLLGWTDCRNIAVSSEKGSLKLYRRKRYHGNTSVIRLSKDVLQSFADDAEAFEVECDSLDSLLANLKRPTSLIKIDVEGAEYQVLRGMTRTIQQNPELRIVLEWAL